MTHPVSPEIRILEGIVTTRNADGTINVAPMGPFVDEEMTALHLRPFQSSQTFQNLNRERQGVFHVTDDALLLADAVTGALRETPPTFPAKIVAGEVLASVCRWYEFRIEEFDDREERARLSAKVVHTGRLRDFFGWNRAKHAVLEAAILATRVEFLAPADIREQFARLKIPVEKTAGPSERTAFQRLEDYVADRIGPRQDES